MSRRLTYKNSGVVYDTLDQCKRAAQKCALRTTTNVFRFGFRESSVGRGESAYLTETQTNFLAHVEEGLGTKNIIADEMYRLTGKSLYACIGEDAIAAIVNDMVVSGALPISCAMHLAAGSSEWFGDRKRYGALFNGWKRGCVKAGCVWGGGETSVLNGLVSPKRFIISGGASGFVQYKGQLIHPKRIQHGDAIILLRSSGIHTNGFTLARKVAESSLRGYLTQLPNGRTVGETLLTPSTIYVPVIEECLKREINIHYAVHITGHGWRKFMRAKRSLAYVIEKLPRGLPIFKFLQKSGEIDDREMYSTFNMGAGFALYVPQKEVKQVFDVCSSLGRRFKPLYAGHVERSSSRKVIVKPKNIEFEEKDLLIR